MTENDLLYLKAELAMAQQSGQSKIMISVSELQGVLHKIERLLSATASIPKPCGFIMGDHLRNLCDGSAMFAKIKRKPNANHSTQLFFMEIVGEDTRSKHRDEMGKRNGAPADQQ